MPTVIRLCRGNTIDGVDRYYRHKGATAGGPIEGFFGYHR